MERKWYIVIISVLVIIIGVLILIYTKGISLGPSVPLETCKTIYANGGKVAANIVIFADKDTATRYADFFFSLAPYSSYKDKFNFYYIDTYKPACQKYQGIALYCYSQELIQKAASCPNDFIVVVNSDDPSLRSSNYMNVMSLNGASPMNVFQHEFGHSFTGLSDEYTPAILPNTAKNCQTDCSAFEGKNDGCFSGCSLDNKQRSIDEGIMRTLSSNTYGKFDDTLIEAKIAAKTGTPAPATGSVIQETQDCTKEKYTLIKGTYENSQIQVTNKNIEYGCVGSNGEGDFSYDLESESGTALKGDFNPELIFTDTQSKNETQINGSVGKQQGDFYLKIPIVEQAKSLQIKDYLGNNLTQINLYDVGARPCRI